MFKHINKNFNNFNKHFNNFTKNNLFKHSLSNLALDNKYYDNYNNSDYISDYNNDEDLFVEKIVYNNEKKYFYELKRPYYLDEDYKEYYFKKFKKIDKICESSGSKCFNCNGTGLTYNGLKYDICNFCNGNGIY